MTLLPRRSITHKIAQILSDSHLTGPYTSSKLPKQEWHVHPGPTYYQAVLPVDVHKLREDIKNRSVEECLPVPLAGSAVIIL